MIDNFEELIESRRQLALFAAKELSVIEERYNSMGMMNRAVDLEQRVNQDAAYMLVRSERDAAKQKYDAAIRDYVAVKNRV